MTNTAAPGWYADPFGRHEHRYYDGSTWTEHVSSHGNPSVDPPGGGNVPVVNRAPQKVQHDIARAGQSGSAAFEGGGSLFTEPVLVVNQLAKLIEINNEYAIFDQHSRQIGAVREVGQSAVKKAVRLLSNYDQFLTHKLQVVDISGTPVLAITRPAKFVKSKVLVTDPAGTEIGQIVQENAFGKIRFALVYQGQKIGSINAENWRAWNFSIRDHTDVQVARITKTWEGLAKAVFTTADNYVVQMHRRLEGPLAALVVAAAVSVDTALKQDGG